MNDLETDRSRVSQPASRTLLELLLLVALCWLFFFYGLNSFGLLGADEPRYAQVAREMLQRHDWVTPVLYGKPWLEKPVGYYWAAMLSYKAFGVNDWAARLPGALAATVMAAFFYWWLRRFRAGTQLDGVVILISTSFVIGFSHGASMDIQLAAPFAVGMLCWWSWYESSKRGWLALFYACMALATLAKGPVAPFLAALVIISFSVLRRESAVVRGSLWLPGILLFLAFAMPWYIAVQHATPQFFREFILQHNLERFGTNRYFHVKPFWYYIPVLLAGIIPWTVFAVAAIWREARVWRSRATVDKPGALGMFLSVWVLAPLLFFSFSHSKLPGYILPCVPPVAVLIALYIRERILQGTKPGWLAPLHALLPAALMASVMIAPSVLVHRRPESQVVTVAVVVVLVVFAGVSLVLLRSGYYGLRTATLVPMAVSLVLLIRMAAPFVDQTQSMRIVAHEIRQFDAAAPVIAFDTPRQVEYGLAYYLDRPLGGPGLQEFSVESANSFPQCGAYVVIGKPGSLDALKIVASGVARIETVRTNRRTDPWEIYSLSQSCPVPSSK